MVTTKNLLFILALLTFCLVYANDQNCDFQVNGMVVDIETREPVPFVNVLISGTDKGAITDEDGKFLIKGICREEFDLQVSYVGYKTATHHHDVYHEPPTIFLAPDNQMLHSVVVEGVYNETQLNTLNLESLSGEEFETHQSKSFGELASRIAGISMLSTGQNIVKPIIHGLHSNRVLIINNGVRHEFQNWGAGHAPEIDPSQASSIKVVKGAATVRYGPDALGGVLLIEPPQLELLSGLHARGSFIGNSNGRSGEVGVDIQQGWHKWGVHVQGNILRQGDLSAPDYQLTNTGKFEYSYSGGFRFHSNRFDLEGYYSRFHQNLGILRGSVTENLDDLSVAMSREVPLYTRAFGYEINTPRQEVTHDLVKVEGTYVGNDHKLSFQYAFQKNQRQEYDVRRGTNNEIPSIDLELMSQSFDLDWQHPGIGGINGMMGAQILYQDNNNIPGTNTIPFIPNYNITRLGVFAIEGMEVGNTLFEAGARFDYQFASVRGREPDNSIYRDEFDFAQVTGSVGIKHQWNDQLSLRSNLGTAWRPPNISELFSYGKHQATFEYGLYYQSEGGKIPEVGIKWLNTLEYRAEDYQFEVTAYLNSIRNFIYTQPAGITNTVRGAFPYYNYFQTDALFIGADMALETEVTNRIRMGGKASYVWARDISNDDVFVGMPPARLDYHASYRQKIDWLTSSSVGLELSYTFEAFQKPRVISTEEIKEANESGEDIFANDDSTFDFLPVPDDYFLAGIFWKAGKGPWDWSIQIQNVFNTSYRSYTDRLRYFADQTGRNFQISVSYHLK